MAQKVQVLLVDDIDGGEAAETVTFSLDGVTYEIDLSEEHASALRDAFAPWVGHARRVGGRGGGTRRAAAPPKQRTSSGGSEGPDTGAVRAWARENGYTVSDRGRISAEIVKAYQDAQG
ncbi:Lsr2 protein [Kineococcus xinjiangensis]|uniref:Lsr2 protein n=1 Tax=Kineococcus xinjiangensis TaxID=512762 RepID=A0A2S6IGW1_9ACTN|nr:Lsr2 family protein [Kineococcus xinjiangensis]PPK93455.1 Lsr2 protein [Kineococcus xinjiangensis]